MTALRGSNRFQVERRLGQGGYGTVFKAHDSVLGLDVALKVLDRVSPDAQVQFKEEFRALADLWHPNLCELYDLVELEHEVVLSMELLEGGGLQEHCRPDGRPDFDRIRAVVTDLAAGLLALHRAGKVHRDLKPANARLDSTGRAKLLDFGLVSKPRPRERAGSGAAGTMAFMAPEAFDGAATPAVDWYSLGVLLYELLAGRLPYSTQWPMTVVRRLREEYEPLPGDVPKDLRLMVTEWLRGDPEIRGDGTSVFGLDALDERTRAFVGRSSESRVVREWLRSTGETRVLVVSGPSGVGKTAFLERALENHPNLLRGRCHPRELLSFNGFDRAIDDLVGQLEPGSREPFAVPFTLPLIQLFPALERICQPAMGPRAAGFSSAEGRIRAFSALRSLLRATGRHWTLWIDDVQWLDRDSRALLTALLGDADLPLSVVLSARDAESGGLAELAAEFPVQHLPLPPLEAASIEALLRASGAKPSEVDGLAVRSGGLPFLALELADAPATDGDPVLESIRRRLDGFDPSAVDLFDLAVVSSRPVPLHLASRLFGAAALRWVGPLRKARLLRPLEGGDELLSPYHDALRQRWREALGREAAVDLHQRAANALLEDDDPDPVLVVEHLRDAGDTRAGVWALRAADGALEAQAFERAATLLELAAETPDPPRPVAELRARQADALAQAGFGTKAAEAVTLALAEEPRVELRRLRARLLVTSGEVPRGAAEWSELLEAHGVRLPATEGAALLPLLRWRYLPSLPLGRPPSAERLETIFRASETLGPFRPLAATVLAARLRVDARRADHPRFRALSCYLEAVFQANLGSFALAQRLLDEGREQVQPAPLILQIWDVTTRGVCATLEGRFEEGARLTREAVELAYRHPREEHGLLEGDIVRAYTFHVWALVMSGQLEAAHTAIRDRLPLAVRRADLVHTDALRHGPVSLNRLARDQPHEAERQSALSTELWSANGESPPLDHGLTTAVRVALYRGDGSRAWELFEAARTTMRRRGFFRFALYGAELRSLRARAAVARAATLPQAERAPLLRVALRESKRIRQAPIHCAEALADLASCNVTALAGSSGERTASLETLRASALDAGLRMHAGMACLALGVDANDDWPEVNRLVAPTRFMRLLLPGVALRESDVELPLPSSHLERLSAAM